MWIQRNRRWLVPVLLAALAAACAVETAPVYRKGGKEYGVTRGLFRSRWWNYYERGCSYADGEYWAEAEADFLSALKQDDHDRRRARTYGVLNFIDYFPHRELGVSYTYEGRYEEAIRELELSIATTPSAKAYYFLDKARRGWLLEQGLDAQAPLLELTEAPAAGAVTNAFQVRICGRARDDFFVAAVRVAGKTVPQEVSVQEIRFCRDVPLKRGLQHLRVEAEDLTGRTVEKTVVVAVDREGPQLGLQEIACQETPGGGRSCTLQGFVDDTHAVRGVWFNGAPVSVPGETPESFAFSGRVLLNRGDDTIAFRTEDIAGNGNEGMIRLAFPSASAAPTGPALSLAALPRLARVLLPGHDRVNDTGGSRLFPSVQRRRGPLQSPGPLASIAVPWSFSGEESRPGESAASGPLLRLKGLVDDYKTYVDTLYVEGSIQGPDPIRSLSLNGQPLLKREGRNLFFGSFFKLEAGENDLTFRAEDARGRKLEKRLRVRYEVPRAWKLSSRLSVFVIPFRQVRCGEATGEYLSQSFLSSLVAQKRFHVVNRSDLDKILREMELSRTELIDPKTAVKLGKIARAEEALVGSVYEGNRSVEVYAQMIDTETREVLLQKDVFHEEKTPDRMRQITQGLALKFKEALPLMDGRIVRVDGDRITSELGEEQRIPQGTRVIVFREGAELVDPRTGRVIGCETELLGEALVQRVEDTCSTAEMLQPGSWCRSLTLLDRVIIK